MAAPKKGAKIGEDAVYSRTGKKWAEWFAILDAAGAARMDHKQIVACLKEYPIGGWWHQMVAVTYEQERGLRARHQKADGYAISVSKTVTAGVAALFRAWNDSKQRSCWLPDAITIRKATAAKSLRITWTDGRSSVEVNLYARGAGKSQVTVQHSKLDSAGQVARMKSFWSDRLRTLKELLETP
jgi:hypothetical protein